MGEKLAINRWAEEDRPREKMAHHGVAALSNAELLAILIGSGNTEDSAVELMRKILSDYHNNLNELGKCSIDDLCHYKGIGPAKAISILAASELGKRRKEEEVKERKKILSSCDVYQYFYPLMCDLPTEWNIVFGSGHFHCSPIRQRTRNLNQSLSKSTVTDNNRAIEVL